MQMTTTFDEARCGREVKARLHDMAVMGDPFSGPAYGQFEKSKGLGMIIGIVASVVTMGAALPMLASTVLATQIAGGIMFAGGALSGIGAVTGNKKLQKIGGVMSLAGGIGAAASGALSAGGAGGAFAEGSGSTAVQNMSGSMMESINNVGGAVGYGDVYDAGKAATAASAGKDVAAPPIEGGVTPVPDAPKVDVAPLDAGGATPAASPTDQATLKLPDTTASTPADKPWQPSAEAMGTDKTTNGVLNSSTDATLKVPDGGGIGGSSTASDPTLKVSASDGINLPKDKGFLNGSLSWAKENAELVKMAGSAIQQGATWAMQPDQQAELAAKAGLYGAQAGFINSQQELLDYQKNNMSKQVAMISADDPQMDAKVKNAGANGVPVVFIPAIGAGGVKPTGSAWNSGTANVSQQPARQPTFGQQPVAA